MEEDWISDSQACDLDLLGEDFLELLSQPLEYNSFIYPIEGYSYQPEDLFEFQDLICIPPTEGTTDSNLPATALDRTAPETSNLIKRHRENAGFNLISISEDQSPTHSSKTLAARKFEDCLSEFAIPQSNNSITRRRKRFSNERRKEVDHIRKAGACIRCRLMKTACKLELPCATCVKACHDNNLGKTLCIRQKLTDVRFTADLWNQSGDLAWLEEEVRGLYGSKKTLKISLAIFCDSSSFLFNTDSDSAIWAAGGHDGPWTVASPLEVEVKAYEPRFGLEHRHFFGDLQDSSAAATVLQLLAIPEESLPSLDKLEAWALESARNHPRAFIGGIRGSFLSLARRYYECTQDLPLQDLVRAAVRLTCLHGIWHSDLPLPRDSHNKSHQYAPRAVRRQISVIVAKGIVDAEVQILSLLQKHIFSKTGPGTRNMLPIWMSLWLLILAYRHTVYEYNGDVRVAQHMYDMLVSIYSALFRQSSPLWLNWLRDDVYELFGRDWRMLKPMGALKTDIGYYADPLKHDCLGQNLSGSHDVLLRSLIVDHERKLGKKLMEKPVDQSSVVREQLVRFDAKCFLVEERFVPPKTTYGQDQINRLLVVRDTSYCTKNWFKAPASLSKDYGQP